MKRLLLTFFLISVIFNLRAQQQTVSIGTEETNPKAILWLKSENQNQGLIIPIVNSKLAMGSLADADKGMIVFSLEDNNLHYWNGTTWNAVGSGSGGGGQTLSFDTDNNKIVLSGGGGSVNLADTKPNTAGQILFWDGLKWNSSVNVAPTNGQVLKWNGTSWQAQADETGTSSLPTLTQNQIISNNGTATIAITISGDLTFDAATGKFTIGNNAVNGNKIADGTIAGADIANNAIDNAKLAADAVKTGNIANGTITGADISDATITTNKIAQSGAIDGDVLTYESSTLMWKPKAPTTAPNYTAGTGIAINGSNVISVSSISANEIATDAVGSSEIAADAVGSAEIAADAVTSAKIAANTITGNDLATNISFSTTGAITTTGGITTNDININTINYTWPSTDGTSTTYLSNDGNGTLTWSGVAASGITGTMAVANGGTGLSTVPSNNQLLIGNGTGYSLSTLTAGTNISFTNTSGLLTINSTALSNPMTTTGDIIFSTNGTGTPGRLAGAAGFLKSTGAAAPGWSAVNLASTDVTGTLPLSNGGIGITTTPANNQLLIGNGTGYSLSTLTAGTNISLTNTAGLLTINSTALSNPMTTTGDIIYSTSGTGSPGRLAGAAGFLKSTGAAAPTWSAIGLASTDVTGTLPVARGGTNISTTPTNGQLLIGNGTNYSLSTLTAGTGISVNNGAGTVTVATSGNFGTQNLSTTGTLSTGAITAPDLNINTIDYTWPNTDGTGTSVLTNDGSGNLTWGAPASVTAGSGLTLTGSTFDLGGTLTTTPKFTNTTGNVILDVVSQNSAVNTKSGFNLRSDAGSTAVQWEIVSRKSDAIANSGNSDLVLSKLFSTAGGNMDMIRLDGGTNDVVINGSKTSTSSYGNFLIQNGNVGIANTAPHGQLQFDNTLLNRKIVLNEFANNDHQYTGFGTAVNTLIYHVGDATGSHLFYGGAGSNSSAEMFRISNSYVSMGGRVTPVSVNGVNSSFDVQTDNGSGLAGMNVDAADPDGQPFYGYSLLGSSKAYTYYNGSYGDWIVSNGGYNSLWVANNGYVGIGNYSAGTYPGSPIEVRTPSGLTDYGFSHTNEDVGMATFVGTLGGGGVGGSIGTTSNHPFYIYVANSGAKASFLPTGGMTIGSTYTGSSGGFAPTNGLVVEGDAGIGTNDPKARLEVYSGQFVSNAADGIVNIGQHTSSHLTMDNNELQAKAAVSGVSTLYLNYWGGNVDIANSGGSTRVGGALQVIGNLTKGSGTFKIDHPLDPTNKYLYHSFVESPDMMNIYNGNVVTDANGDATISLPQYFSALNKDFRYQLTPIGQFAQAIISEEINENTNVFTIKTDKPNVKVSWQVTGVRKDAYANMNRVVPEVEKTGDEKGTYLHPEAFGVPSNKKQNANNQ